MFNSIKRAWNTFLEWFGKRANIFVGLIALFYILSSSPTEFQSLVIFFLFIIFNEIFSWHEAEVLVQNYKDK